MANDYAPRQFLRQIQTPLLREYFRRRGTELKGVAWERLEEADENPIYNTWHRLPEATRAEIEGEWRRIHALGTSDGTQTTLEEGRFHGLDLRPELDKLDGHLNKALWTFIYQQGVFEVAEKFDWADHLNRRSMRKRKDIPKKKPDVSKRAVRELGDAVGAYFRENQGRGWPCRAEPYLRDGRDHYVFLYPKDYTDIIIGYDEKDRFERRPWNPAFEVVYVYNPEEGTLELYVQGDKKVVRDLQELFARTVLHEELGEEAPDSAPYDLSSLKHQRPFPTDPADHILEVRVSALKLTLMGGAEKRITFEADSKASGGVYELMKTALDERRLPLATVDVKSAVMKMLFENTTGRGRSTKTLTIRISQPNSCNLKDSPEELVAKKYLRAWQLERA